MQGCAWPISDRILCKQAFGEIMEKRISILGASGSVGSQALEVAALRDYRVDFISGNLAVDKIESAVRRFAPSYACMADERSALELKTRIADTRTKVLFGEEGVLEGIRECGSDKIINAILGKAGLLPTLEILESGAELALANKESLVVAGDLVMNKARALGKTIIPVDSEHSAIFQSLSSGAHGELKRIILTASGGPFFGRKSHELDGITAADALKHPTWKMGKKITVDSATLMNKGFEVIEAAHLFNLPSDRIEVVIHRESILHSAVEYIDNAVIGEMSVPDMRMCVQYAVEYPRRADAVIESLDFTKLGTLSFAKPDYEAFPLLSLAGRAAMDGGCSGAVLNAADEIAVEAFLADKISFRRISEIVERTYFSLSEAKNSQDLQAILEYDEIARKKARELISKI